jgi:hypothetical protein
LQHRSNHLRRSVDGAIRHIVRLAPRADPVKHVGVNAAEFYAVKVSVKPTQVRPIVGM